jgi:hypothetical protein
VPVRWCIPPGFRYTLFSRRYYEGASELLPGTREVQGRFVGPWASSGRFECLVDGEWKVVEDAGPGLCVPDISVKPERALPKGRILLILSAARGRSPRNSELCGAPGRVMVFFHGRHDGFASFPMV